MKPLDARLIEARTRARDSQCRLYVGQSGGAYRVRSYGGDWHLINSTKAGWTCSCDGFKYTGCCKHLAALTRRSEREGWTLGTIAPAPYVPETQAAD